LPVPFDRESKFTKYTSGTDFDQVLWTQFWQQNQKYRTICLPCIVNDKKTGGPLEMGNNTFHEDAPEIHGYDFGPTKLEDTSKIIISRWKETAQNRLSRNGDLRKKCDANVISDDERGDSIFLWKNLETKFDNRTKHVARKWLRFAQKNLSQQNHTKIQKDV